MAATEQGSAEAIEVPDWAQGYADPVIHVPGNNGTKYHEPDFSADEPVPNCQDGRGHDFVVKERAALEPIYDACKRHYCKEVRDDTQNV